MPSKDEEDPVSEGRAKQRVLVVGDWFVDEHWATGHHRSGTASRMGRTHQRSLHKPDHAVQSLCGAGRTASVLHQAKVGHACLFDTYGIGMWHRADTHLLEQMLDPSTHAGHTPFRIERSAPQGQSTGRLFTLSALPRLQDKVRGDEVHGTEHIIRTYQRRGARFEVSERIDWILRPTRGGKPAEEWITGETDLEGCPELDKVADPVHTAAVVIKDHGRGVISVPLIKWLKARLPKALWFVSSKAWMPTWFNELPTPNLRVLLIPQVPAQTAVQNAMLGCWLTRSGWATKEALDIMDSMHNEYFKDSARSMVIVLPEGCTVLSREQAGAHPPSGWIQLRAELERVAAPVPMASVFLPALVGHIMTKENLEHQELLKRSLAFTQEWMTHEGGRIDDPDKWNPQEPSLAPFADPKTPSVGKWDPLEDWLDVTDQWGQAYGVKKGARMGPESEPGWGFIESATEKRIELWRAMTDLEGYVCLVESKRRAVRKLVTIFDRFTRGEATDHVSCMVISEPGAGKTFLARRLASALNMRYLPFNITQMLSKQDLIKCFDRIATIAQSPDQEERILVFIDEINATIAREFVYGSFLAPLEERVFIQDGQPHPIPPCAWLFAGTRDPGEEGKETKGPDFRSRLTLEPLKLRVEKDEEQRARLENIYLGIALIQAIYPDVRFVSEKIAKMFHKIPPTTEENEKGKSADKAAVRVRDIEQFVRLFDEVQYGEVRDRNVRVDVIRSEIGKKFGINLTAWGDEDDGSLVRIVG